MMNLSKVNKKNKHMKMSGRIGRSLITGACSAILFSGMAAVPAMAEAVDPAEAISIEKPSGWKQGSTDVHITVDGSHLGEGVSVSKVEAKVGEGSWQDVTAGMAVTINTNTTVYVRITDSEGNIYEQNRSIRCYDTEKPTLSASLTDGVLTIQGQDTFSGISRITVNGAEYKELKDGVLKIQLTQKDFTTKKIEITVTDGAGNTSDTYSLQNPYYEWAVKQAIAQQADTSGDLSTTTGTTQETEVTAPLPQSATSSEPTESRGTVEDRTITGIEQELAQKNETVDTISSTTTAGGKEFYTISTKSGKVFYLIIDNDSKQDNVYFLTEVDNEDLMNFTLSDTVTLPAVDTVYATLEDKPEPTPMTEVTPEPETEQPETEVQMPEEQSKLPGYVLLGILCTGALAGAYYFKIYRPKQDDFDEEEYEEDLAQEEEAQREVPEYLDDEDDEGLNLPGHFLDDEED